MENVKQRVGNSLRQIRKAKGYTQESLGEKAGFHFSYIGKIERGEKNISLENLERLAKALGVGVHQFFGYAYELEELTAKDRLAKEILHLLMKQNERGLRKGLSVLKEIFEED
ncbi:transcriptional regulator with XRE-family HTH domain [Paenibacillus phyllosphaerae]|uniref:Transcriptional regulator with XRE-family HTH domain n=1 Tax=Paenibacillus phyllosphaerae TaxID=274593 RepID=A0A7W5AV18_9BACL|nr:helix-turn-helix transcriptional regulator [Paenibacillus phyllosphaerae]MBB3109127.1 transcriptional regulator with XRE-family HTH domain [Paenibacillus phyllosphaerae]